MQKRMYDEFGCSDLIASAVGSLAAPLLGVGLGPGPSAVVDGRAVHDAAVVIVLSTSRVAVVVVGWVDVGEAVASAVSGVTARSRGVRLGPGPSAVVRGDAEASLYCAVIIQSGLA